MTSIRVVDFDGTLVSKNTFPRWVLHLLFSSVTTFRLRRALYLTFLLILRKAARIGHTDFKQRVASLGATEDEVRRFADRAARWANRPVVEELRGAAGPLVVATAAIDKYVAPTLARLGLEPDVILASRFVDDGGYLDNSREIKADAVASTLSRLGLDDSRVVVFTDHVDDLALAALADEVVLCVSDQATVRQFGRLGPDLRLIARPVEGQGRLKPLDLSSEDRFAEACHVLAERVVEQVGRPQLVIGIATGGVRVGEVVAAALGAPFAGVKAQRPTTAAKGRPRVEQFVGVLPSRLAWTLRRFETMVSEAVYTVRAEPVTEREVVFLQEVDSLPLKAVGRVLVVDDAVDSGHTLRAVVTTLERVLPQASIVTATLSMSYRSPVVVPDVCLYPRTLLRGPWSLDARK
jgi:hypoxanthine phosphoribosyltransferase/phosphoserine phosphatase